MLPQHLEGCKATALATRKVLKLEGLGVAVDDGAHMYESLQEVAQVLDVPSLSLTASTGGGTLRPLQPQRPNPQEFSPEKSRAEAVRGWLGVGTAGWLTGPPPAPRGRLEKKHLEAVRGKAFGG